MDADKAVLMSAVATLGSTTAASVLPSQYGGKGEIPPARLLIGTSLAFMSLSMMAQFAPSLASILSLAIAVTALGYYGMPVADNYFNGHHNIVGSPLKG